MIFPKLYIRNYQATDGGIRATKHDILSGSFKIVINNLERPRAVPATYRLSIKRCAVDIGEIRIDDRRGGAVKSNGASRLSSVVAVNVATIDYYVVRHRSERVLRSPITKHNNSIGAG